VCGEDDEWTGIKGVEDYVVRRLVYDESILYKKRMIT
jgi:hypothetical protein